MKALTTFVLLVMAAVSMGAPQKQPKMKWVLADGAPQTLQAVIDGQGTFRPTRIEFLENRIKELKAQMNKEKNRDNRERLRGEVIGYENQIKAIKSDEVIVVPSDLPSRVGLSGNVESIIVRQIVDEKTAMVTLVHSEPPYVVGKNTDHPRVEPGREIKIDVWMTGADTSQWSDGQGFELPESQRLWYCDSTHKYETVTGASRTIPEIKPFTMDAFKRVPVE